MPAVYAMAPHVSPGATVAFWAHAGLLNAGGVGATVGAVTPATAGKDEGEDASAGLATHTCKSIAHANRPERDHTTSGSVWT
jgi:hypothetical protein